MPRPSSVDHAYLTGRPATEIPSAVPANNAPSSMGSGETSTTITYVYHSPCCAGSATFTASTPWPVWPPTVMAYTPATVYSPSMGYTPVLQSHCFYVPSSCHCHHSSLPPPTPLERPQSLVAREGLTVGQPANSNNAPAAPPTPAPAGPQVFLRSNKRSSTPAPQYVAPARPPPVPQYYFYPSWMVTPVWTPTTVHCTPPMVTYSPSAVCTPISAVGPPLPAVWL
ncbi:hypothetical protein F5880DRAFT_1698921 [Lentinula raphanica]|nr:hypothetical protein F5880DRAFT_1698921 [Lentinula raphanica]